MRPIPLMFILATLAGCAAPLPAHDPGMAWVDLGTTTGKLVMADKLDGKNTWDGRYFQVSPGGHKLVVRYDYEYRAGMSLGMFSDDYTETTCFITLEYAHFQPGERYRLQVRSLANDIEARLYDPQRREVTREQDIHCI